MPDPVRFHAASSVADACAQLATFGDDARVVCGGTALAILMRQGLVRPEVLVAVGQIPELGELTVGPDGTLRLGAALRLRRAERDPRVRAGWPMLADALASVATPRIRNMATVGGGLAHADPAQDPPVALAAWDASVVVRGRRERRIPAASFAAGYYENALEPGEIVVAIEVPPAPARTGGAYLKFLPRSVDDYGVVTAAALVTLDADGRCVNARLALGAVGERPLVVDVASLRGSPIGEAAALEAAEEARTLVDPVSDVRGSASYKREMATVFARRALLLAAQRAARFDAPAAQGTA